MFSSVSQRLGSRRAGKAREGSSVFQRLHQIWTTDGLHQLHHWTLALHFYCGPNRDTMVDVTLGKASPQSRCIFHRSGLRAILGISWRDYVTSDEVLRSSKMEQLWGIVSSRRLESIRWTYVITSTRRKASNALSLGAFRRSKRKTIEDVTSNVQRWPWSNENYQAMSQESRVTAHDGENSSPTVPTGAGKLRSKYTEQSER